MSIDLEESVIVDPYAEMPQSEADIIDPRVHEKPEGDVDIIDPRVQAPQGKVEIIVPETGTSVREPVDPNLQELGTKLSQAIENLPRQIAAFYRAYQRPINLLGVSFLGLLTVAIASGVLRVLDALPLVAPSLELVGLGYIGWFTWRYLLYAENRQELTAKYRSTKQKVLGQNSERSKQP
ncbi:hypothetical protein C1752_08655 [Acaryochloris thomasi RCC1774]|uniref:Cyanobacterial aminoacyl-tRNA synthetase CAAD domain-containing protein n=1 Tax=Acaryochloris thomasi RCC1774 TaxID=1764569 RepID=A0A2W1JLA4_9CYAN|nr:CAAD domain-containing protein [Acaryochloris thomasi]PZD70974.1 hypothetical protein C1752_08655 [Acaryochloris thomasi RCC1774]